MARPDALPLQEWPLLAGAPSRVQGERDWAEWLSPEQAAAWLLHNDYEIPDELKEAANRVEE